MDWVGLVVIALFFSVIGLDSIELAKLVLKAYQEISLKFIEVSLEQALELSSRLKLCAYDAYVIQCAQQTSTPLLTLDGSLKSIAETVGIQVFEVT